MHSAIRFALVGCILLLLAARPTASQAGPTLTESRLFEEHGSVMLIIDPASGGIVAANEAAREFYGYGDLLERNINEINQLSADEVASEMRLAAREQRNFFRFLHATQNRGFRHVEVYSYPIGFNGGDYLFSIIIDITSRVEAERNIVSLRRTLVVAAVVGTVFFLVFLLLVILRIRDRLRSTQKSLERTEHRYRAYVDSAPLGVFVTDSDGRYLEVNPAACRLTGYNESELLRLTIADLVVPDDVDAALDHFRGLADGDYAPVELRFRTRSGEVRWWAVSATRLPGNRYLGLAEDISERKQDEQEHAMLFHEKERLLQEVRHRVKNNMSAMEGLLDLQARSLDEKVAVDAIREAQTRVQSLRVLYEQLFRADAEDSASLNEYVSTLVRQILSVFPPVPGLELVLRGSDDGDCVLDAARLPTIGLIVNELVTNAMKYAFPPSVEHGLLEVELKYTDDRVEVSVADNGPGIPNSVASEPQSGFGLGMVTALVEQLNGHMHIESNAAEARGNRVTFSFPR